MITRIREEKEQKWNRYSKLQKDCEKRLSRKKYFCGPTEIEMGFFKLKKKTEKEFQYQKYTGTELKFVFFY